MHVHVYEHLHNLPSQKEKEIERGKETYRQTEYKTSIFTTQIKHANVIKQMLVIAFHEFGHAITACCTGGRVESISLDPHEGGVTHMRGGKQAITLPAGYLGSSLIGALLTFCGFNINASKICSIVLGVCFLLTLWWGKKDWLTILTILLAVGLLVACWFIKHAEPLRFVVVSLSSLLLSLSLFVL